MRKNKHIYSVLAALILLLSASPIFAKNSSASSEELLNKYNIRIINFEPAQPITNKNAGSTSYEKDL